MSRGDIHVDFLKRVVGGGGQIAGARFSLQRGLLKSVEPMFYLRLEQKGVQSLQEVPWSAELETYLLFERGLRMDSPDDEIERFAAILLNNLETAGESYGKDTARSILVSILRGSDSYNSMEPLARIPSYATGESPVVLACKSFLAGSIDGLHNSAILNLGYRDEVHALMTAALSIVLDEAFHLSARDALFPSGATNEH